MSRISFSTCLSTVLVVLLGMLCWGTDAPGDAASPNGSKFITAKINALRGAFLRKNEVTDVMSETDINAYINSRVLNAAGGSGGLKITLEEVSIDLQQDKVFAWLSTKLGPVPLTYTAEVALSRGAGRRLEFKAGSVSIGHVTKRNLSHDTNPGVI